MAELRIYYETLAQAAEKELPTPVIMELAKLLQRKDLELGLFGNLKNFGITGKHAMINTED